jgi:hypothetical protein
LIFAKLLHNLARYSSSKILLYTNFRKWKTATFLGLQSSLKVKMIISADQLEEENERLKNEMENRSWGSSLYQSNQSLGNLGAGCAGGCLESKFANFGGKNSGEMIVEKIKIGTDFGGATDAKMFDKKMFESSRELKEELTLSYLTYIQIQNEE